MTEEKSMSLTELIPIICALSSSEKAQLLDMLKTKLAGEDKIAPLEHHKTYPLWTPYGAFGVARALVIASLSSESEHD